MRTRDAMTEFDAAERLRWSGRAEAYQASFARLCAHPVDALLDAARVAAGTRVLDVGTGTGAAAAAAVRRHATVTAVDAEPSMVALAAESVPEANVSVATLPDLPFDDDAFDAAVANFVLNHVGQPRRTLTELRRIIRPGGWVALTIWAVPSAPGQALLMRAVREAGVVSIPVALDPADDFVRTIEGLTTLLTEAGLRDVFCEEVSWDHVVSPEVWWSGPASGTATIGQLVMSQPPEVVVAIKARFDVLRAEFARADGNLVLPHRALLARGRA